MNQVIRNTALSAAISLSLLGTARADDAKDIDTVVVTANRSAVPADEVLASVTVIERSDIEASQAPDLLSLLARQAGMDLVRTGGPGQTNTLFLRGGIASHTLVLIDGIRVNSANQGNFDFAHLPLSQIERIEIVRGPRAALWGSDAIGGVIHIFTRDPSAGYIEARAGSYGLGGLNAGFGTAHVAIGAGFETQRGFSATNPAAGPGSYDPDNDGYTNRNLSLRVHGDVGTQHVALTGLITDADVEFDIGETAAINRELGIVLWGEINDRWSHSITLGHNSEDLNTPDFDSHFGSERSTLDWVNTFTLNADNTLNLGANWAHETGFSESSTEVSFDEGRRNLAVFASWRGHFGTQTFELSARRDDNSQFDGATTGNAAWGLDVNDSLRVRASWGQGFRAPNFNELYYPGFFGFFAGNPDLRPERSISQEIGVDWLATLSQRVSVSLYRTRVRDLIAFTSPTFGAENVNRAAIDGAELDYHFEHGAFRLDGNATWQDARNALTDLPLLRRPDRKLSLSGSYRFSNDAALGLDASAYSSRPDIGGDLPGYARFDLRGSLPLTAGWTLEARIENVFDREYQLLEGYNTPGRSGVVNLRWNGK
ncbi:TonB-dependent receptor domain-containing protein [Arenimonas oryziterrae]|uniref:TonB-dependent receptor n=1 Tax=Arenimonas oryziterrae DSM 21050 = YC6267 TaxID=1121015 RepID=A0A091BGV9_9GAMM|nr:TonB-dependent receptor [Arenimonas oryziterrae]KFN43615.1 hypothetical protein N789_10085 [Arenimonas oryziterrae DSM 21050 = YC6267]